MTVIDQCGLNHHMAEFMRESIEKVQHEFDSSASGEVVEIVEGLDQVCAPTPARITGSQGIPATMLTNSAKPTSPSSQFVCSTSNWK